MVAPGTLRAMSRGMAYRTATITGGVVADTQLGSQGVARSAGVEGDGATVGSHAGVGIYPAATNLCTNGNAATNTTGITEHSSTTTRVASGVVQFGTTAFEVVSSNLVANEGPSQAISGGAASTQYTVSAWAWLISGAATVRAVLNDSVSGKQGGTAVALTASPQRITVTATTGAASANWTGHIETTVQQVGTWRIGGWQIETGPIATPYIHTDGATATRPAGRVQMAVPQGFNVTNAAVITSLTPAWPGATAQAHRIFSWRDAGNGIEAGYDTSNVRAIAGAGYGTNQASIGYGAGYGADVSHIFVSRFSSTQVSAALDGMGFTNTARTLFSTPATTVIEIGDLQEGGGQLFNGRFRWAAFYGPGGQFLSDADSAYVATLPASPHWRQLPRSRDIVAFWDGVSGRVIYPHGIRRAA